MNCLGFVGSDALVETDASVRRGLETNPIFPLVARFAIAARAEEVEQTTQRLRNKTPLTIATSNPRQLEITAARYGFRLREIVVLGGAVESAPDDDPEIDAVFDIVSSGKTMRANNLKIIADNLQVLAITAVWKKPTN